MLRPPIERHALSMVWHGEPDKFLPLAFITLKSYPRVCGGEPTLYEVKNLCSHRYPRVCGGEPLVLRGDVWHVTVIPACAGVSR